MDVFLVERTSDKENNSAVLNKYRNAGILEKRLVRHRHFSCMSTVSVRHQAQSGTAGQGLVRHCPAIVHIFQ
jgi:hypothetical protein